MRQTTQHMIDIALFVDSGKGWRKLSTYESALASDDDAGLVKAFSHFRKQAQMWSSNVSAYYTAQFAIFSSPHGRDDFTLLRRI